MKNFVKNKILIIDKKGKEFYFYIKMWYQFLNDIIHLNKNSFHVFGNQIWHYGWDYENRKQTYKQIFSEGSSCVSLDLNNRFMLDVFLFFLKVRKFETANFNTSSQIDKFKDEIFFRNFWDVDKNSNKVYPNTSSIDYNAQYEKWKTVNHNRLRMMWVKGDKLFCYSNLKSLIVSQFGYEDWAWASLCLINRKYVYSPEANFGFTRLIGEIEEAEASFVSKSSKKLSFKLLKKGLLSLHARCNGNYSISAIGYYMSDFKSEKVKIMPNYDCGFVLYLHAFGDSPNNTISNYSNTFGIDYFDSTLKILEYFEKNEKHLAVKFHPLSNQYNYDIKCNQVIREIVNKSVYLSFSESFPINLLNQYYPNASIITGRGSIISEACFCRIQSFSFCKSVYTELGMSIYFNEVESLFDLRKKIIMHTFQARKWAIKLESIRLKSLDNSVYKFSNYNKDSKRLDKFEILKGFLESERVVNLSSIEK
jgi:hypothetical protein